MLTTKPFLLMIRMHGTTFPYLVYSEDYDGACVKINELFPECEITNNTIL